MATRTKSSRKKSSGRSAASHTGLSGGRIATPSEADKKRALRMVMELMAIPGKSGQEGAVARYITEKLRGAGVPASAIRTDKAHQKTPLAGETGNLICQLPGTASAPRRLLMAHMDTVPICVGCRPVQKGRFVRSADPRTGLGGDDRAGVTVVLNTALDILRRNLPHPPLTFLWPIQEEVGLQGARCLQLGLLGKPRLAFNFDGGSTDKLTVAATGGYRIRIEIEGLASHAGAWPERGVSAITIASLAIAQLVRDGWHGLVLKDGKAGTSNVGYVHGGEATNVVTDYVELKAEARSHDKAFRKRIVKAIEGAFKDAARQVKSSEGKCGKVRVTGNLDYEAFRLRSDEPVVRAAERAVRSVGLEPECAVSNGGLDANWMTAHGIPTVTLGCGQMRIHTTGEMLDIDAFQQACQIGLHAATELNDH